MTDFASHITEPLQGFVGNLPEVLLAFRLTNHDVNGLHGSSRRCGRDACRENVTARVMTQVIGYHLAGGDKTAKRCNRLGESTHDKVYLVAESEMVAHTASTFSKDADTVSLINHDAGVILVCQVHNVGKLAHVALHRENAVGNDELYTIGLTLLELSLKRSHVVVLVLERVGE